MPMIRKALPVFLLAALLSVGGCVPSDAEIAAEMNASRREAYIEWKTLRERGRQSEVLVNGPLSLDDAVKLALQYNKSLQSSLQEREITRGDRISAYAVVMPGVTMSGNAARVENGRGNNDIDRYSAGVTVNQPIFEGEAIPARLRTARLMTALTDETIRSAVQNLIQTIAGNYYDILLAQHMVETHREALISAETQFRMVSEKKKQETATEYDVLRAQVDVATYRARMISEQNAIDSGRVNLLRNMGVSQDSEVSFSDKLEFLPMRPIFERAVELASGNRPDLRHAELTVRMEEQAVRIARSAFWPKVAGSFTSNWSDGWGVGGDSFGRQPWQAGLTASYTLGIDKAGDLVAAKARVKQSQIDLLDNQALVLMEIREQMNTLANAEEMVKALVVNLDAAREALRLVLVGYQAGVRTEVDVTDARRSLTEVMGQYFSSLADHTKARLNLQVAMGVLGPARIGDAPIMPPAVPIANITEFAATDYVPPEPIPMPSADDLEPVSRFSPIAPEPVSHAPVAPASRWLPVAPVPFAAPAPEVSRAAPELIPAPMPASFAAPAAVSPGRTRMNRPLEAETVVASAANPVKPAASTVQAPAAPPAPAPAESSSAPAPEAAPEVAPEPKATPMFKIKVRDAGEVAVR